MSKKVGENIVTSDDVEYQAFELNSFKNNLHQSISVEELFPWEIYRHINQRAKALPCDPVAYILPTLCAVASLVGTRCRFEVKKGWSEPAVIYGANVSPPSSLKSQIAADVISPLETMEARSLKEQKQRNKACGEDEPTEQARRFQVQGTTHAALVQLLCNERTQGLLAYHDELSTLFAEMELSHNAPMRAELLKLWNGAGLSHDRAGGVLRYAECTALSIFGNVQPDRLADLMAPDSAGTNGGDGLWCRFLFFRPADIPYHFNEEEADLSTELSKLYEVIDAMPSMTFALSEEAKKIGAEEWSFYNELARHTNAAEAAFLGKLRGYSVRIAGLLHIIDVAAKGSSFTSSSSIPKKCMERAVSLCGYFIAQFRQLHAELGHATLPKPIAKIIKKVELDGVRRLATRDVLRCKLLGSKARGLEAERFLRELVEKWNYGTIELSPRGSVTWVAPEPGFSPLSLN